MARIHPKEVCGSDTTFVNTVLNNLTNPESESLQSLSIQTLGFIGSSIDGKMALEKLGINPFRTLLSLILNSFLASGDILLSAGNHFKQFGPRSGPTDPNHLTIWWCS